MKIIFLIGLWSSRLKYWGCFWIYMNWAISSTSQMIRHKKRVHNQSDINTLPLMKTAEQAECILRKVGNYPYFYLQKIMVEKRSRSKMELRRQTTWCLGCCREYIASYSVHNIISCTGIGRLQITDGPYNDMNILCWTGENRVLWSEAEWRTAWCGNCRHAYGLYIRPG